MGMVYHMTVVLILIVSYYTECSTHIHMVETIRTKHFQKKVVRICIHTFIRYLTFYCKRIADTFPGYT